MGVNKTKKNYLMSNKDKEPELNVYLKNTKGPEILPSVCTAKIFPENQTVTLYKFKRDVDVLPKKNFKN